MLKLMSDFMRNSKDSLLSLDKHFLIHYLPNPVKDVQYKCIKAEILTFKYFQKVTQVNEHLQ